MVQTVLTPTEALVYVRNRLVCYSNVDFIKQTPGRAPARPAMITTLEHVLEAFHQYLRAD